MVIAERKKIYSLYLGTIKGVRFTIPQKRKKQAL